MASAAGAARAAVDAAALGQAAARCLEMLEEFPTTLEEDEQMLCELADADGNEVGGRGRRGPRA